RLIKMGAGNLTLSGDNNTYSGATWVNGGTLTVLGSITTSPVTNYAGTTLAGTGYLGGVVDMEAGSTLSPGVNDYGMMTCAGDLFFNGGTNVVEISTTNLDQITVGGRLHLISGAVRLVVREPLPNGTYKLIGSNLSLDGSAANISLSGFSQPGQIARLSDAVGGELDLVVEPVGSANLVWTTVGVAQDNLWNIVTSINWTNDSGMTTFHTGDHVTFDDSGAANSPVDLRALVEPSSILVTGSNAYAFTATTGAGRISGTNSTLTVTGTGSLTVGMVNDFGGVTTIGSGATLNVGTGNSASLGTGSITNSGALVFNQTNVLALGDISGPGSLTKNGGSTLTLTSNYTYTGSTTIGAGATLQVGTNGSTGPLLGAVVANGTLTMNQSGSLTMDKNISGSGTFIKNGTSEMTLGGTNTYQGNTYINNGTLKLGASEVIPDAVAVPGSVGWLILDGGATTAGTLDLNGHDDSVNLLIGATGTVLGPSATTLAAPARLTTAWSPKIWPAARLPWSSAAPARTC
ncbi:MAG: autotransporter-associated beta strand repeat-containing protein, partial [Verrucomicrobia bacterium]|nr:autotransporter-associated beta strand repeat-containing protein [Verrucomicrobiota bacterium]